MFKTSTSYLQNLIQITNAIQELKDQHSTGFDYRMKSIVENVFGHRDYEGYISKRAQFYMQQSPLLWIHQVEDICELVDQNSHFIRKIAERANNIVQIQGQILPQNVIHEFQHTEMHQSRLWPGLKRNSSTSPFLTYMLQWLVAKILHRFMKMSGFYFKKTLNDDQNQDQMFFYLSRNFYLIFLRKMLILLKQISLPLFQRAVSLVHSYLIDELIYKYKRKTLNKQQNYHDIYYKLKSHYIQLLYIVINLSKPLDEERIAMYYEYLSKITQNYSDITNLSQNDNIDMIGRLWITLLCRNQSNQSLLISHLSKANQQQGWFRLKRIPLNQLYNCIKNLKINTKQLKQCLLIKGNILKLIKRKNEWVPSFGMLRLIQSIMIINHISTPYIKNNQLDQQKIIINNATNRLLQHFFKEGKSELQIRQLHKNISTIFDIFCRGKMSFLVQFNNNKSQEEISTLQNRQCMNRIKPSINNAWSFPLQKSQIRILYDINYKISQAIDRLMGYKQQAYPKTNLRIFSNFFIVLIMSITIFLFIL